MGAFTEQLTEAGKHSGREQAIIDRRVSEAGAGSFLKGLAKDVAQVEIDQRRAQRAYAEKAPRQAVEPVKEMLSNLGNRAKVLEIMRTMTPEQQAEALKLAPGVSQQLGDDRGGAIARTAGAIGRGISHGVSQPAMELMGQVMGSEIAQNPVVSPLGYIAGPLLKDLGGTPEEIEYIRQLDAAASQELSPARPGDPWYERGPLQAAEMAPWMATVVGAGGAGRAITTAAARPLAGRMALATGLGRATLNIAGKTGELAGITAAAFPGQYAQEVDQLKELGMEDGTKLRLLAAGTATVSGLIEGIVPNPIPGKVSLTEGAVKAARQYLWEAAKKAPGEMSEEYLQGVTSGLGEHIAQYLDKNAESKSVGDAFVKGWEQAKEAALPMAFLLGVPAVGGAGLNSLRAQQLSRLKDIRAKGFVSEADAKEAGIEGKNRKERLANADAKIKQLEEAAQGGNEIPPTTPGQPTIPPQVPPPLPGSPGATVVAQPPAPPPAPPQTPPSIPGSPQVVPPSLPGSPQATQVTPPPQAQGVPVDADGNPTKPTADPNVFVDSIGTEYWGGKHPKDMSLDEYRSYRDKGFEGIDFAQSGKQILDYKNHPQGYFGGELEAIKRHYGTSDSTSTPEGALEQTSTIVDKMTPDRTEKPAAETSAPAPPETLPIGNKSGQAPEPTSSASDVVIGTGQGPLDVKGKLYREDPNAKTPSERLKSRQAVDPSEGVVLATRDQWGKPIDQDTLNARQEFADKAKPGAEFNIKGFETSGPYRVQDDGQLLDTKTGRVMGDVQSRANQVKPGDITWTKEASVPQQPKGSDPATQAGQVPPSNPTTGTVPPAQAAPKPEKIKGPKPQEKLSHDTKSSVPSRREAIENAVAVNQGGREALSELTSSPRSDKEIKDFINERLGFTGGSGNVSVRNGKITIGYGDQAESLSGKSLVGAIRTEFKIDAPTQPSADQVDSGTESKVKPETATDADLEAMIEAEFDTQLGVKNPPKKLTGKKSEKPKVKADTSKYGDTPIGRQFAEAKAAGGDDTMLLFRMGDFYELYFEDAQKAAKLLGLTLVTRDKSADNPILMAGFPHHQIDGYLKKLKSAGIRVAINEEPFKAKQPTKKRTGKSKTGIQKAADTARQKPPSEMTEQEKDAEVEKLFGKKPEPPKTIGELRKLTFDSVRDAEVTEGVGKNKGVTYRRKTYEVTDENGKQRRYKVTINDRDNDLKIEDLGITKEQQKTDEIANYDSLKPETKQKIIDIGLDDNLSYYQKYDVGLFIEGRTDGTRGTERAVQITLGGAVRPKIIAEAMGRAGDATVTWEDVFKFLRQTKPKTGADIPASSKGFSDLPKVSRSIFETAMQNDTPDSLLEILHSGNKTMRAEFESRTGVKLPKTVKGTKQVIEQWFKDGKKPATKPSADQVNVDSGEKNNVKPEDDLEAMINAEFDAQLGTEKKPALDDNVSKNDPRNVTVLRYIQQANIKPDARKVKFKSGEVDVVGDTYGDLAVAQKIGDDGKPYSALLHVPTGLEVTSAGKTTEQKQLARMLNDAGVDFSFQRAGDMKKPDVDATKAIIHAWTYDDYASLPQDLYERFAKKAVAPESTGATFDITKDHLTGNLRNEAYAKTLTPLIKQLSSNVPEFAYNPVMRMSDEGTLVYHDHFQYQFNPEKILPKGVKLEPGQTVSFTLSDFGVKTKATPEQVVADSLKSAGFSVRKGKGGFKAAFGDSTVEVNGADKTWTVTGGSPEANALANHQVSGIAWEQPGIATDRAVAESMPVKSANDVATNAAPVVLDNVSDVRQFLASGSYLNTPDKALNLMMIRGDLVLRAPKAKSRGGKYTLNSSILSAAAPLEFVSIGSRMEMVVQDKSQQDAVLSAVMSVASLQADSDKNLARQIKQASESLRKTDTDTDVLYQKTNVDPQIVVQATDLAIDAQDAEMNKLESFEQWPEDVKQNTDPRSSKSPRSGSGNSLNEFTSPELQNRQSMGAAKVVIASAADLVGEEDAGSTSQYASPDGEFERRWQQATNGIGKKTLATKLREFWSELVKSTVRGSLPELPRTKQFGEARSAMHAYQNAPTYAQLATADLLKKTTKPLSAKDYDLFTRIVIMRDQVEAADRGERLSYGLTPAKAKAELDRLEALAETNERVQASLEYRSQWTEAMVDDFLSAHEYLGLDMSDRFKRENYFRHQVLYYMEAQQRGLGKKKVELTPNRGWLKGRTSGEDLGEDFDINANYLQAEWEVATQMIADTKRAQAIGRLKRHYDKMRQLKEKAKYNNYVAVVGGQDVMDEIEDLRGRMDEMRAQGSLDSGEKAQMKAWSERLWELDPTMPFRRDMAIARDKIERGASNLGEEVPDEFVRYAKSLAERDGHPLQTLALKFLKAMSDRKAFIKNSLGDDYQTWEDVVPDDYEEVAIRPGRAMFQAYSVSEQVASELMADLSTTLGISAEDLRPITALGSKYTPLVVPQEVAAQMMAVDNKMDFGWLDRIVTKPMNAWKRWVLMAPTRILKYNLRNLSEVDKVMALNPAALKEVPQAIQDLWKLYSGADAIPSNVRDWVERGGTTTLVQVNELGEVNELKEFAKLVSDKKSGVAGKLIKAPVGAWKKYWSVANISSNFRESILRYAAYLSYMKQLEAGKLTNYGGSVRAEVDGIEDNKDKAMRLSADLLGDYSDISLVGQFMRSRMAPFWSFQETNVRTYFRGLMNLASNEQSAIKAGMKIARAAGYAGLAKTPFLAYKLGRIAILFYGLQAMATGFNQLLFPDDDDDLPEDEKRRAHLTLGKNSNGEVQYFSRIGTAADVLDWIGLDSVDYDLRDVLDGRRTVRDVLNDMVRSPVDKAYGMLSPFMKAPAELAVGQTAYPNVGKPRPIRDRAEYIAKNLGIEKEYDKLVGNPSTPYAISDLVLYKVEPGTSVYYMTLDAKARWLKTARNRGVGYSESARGNAMRNYKMAMRLNDRVAADKYLAEFTAAGGTKDGMLDSLESSHPAGGLSTVDSILFYNELEPVEKDEYRRAEQFYYSELLTEEQAAAIRARREKRIKDLASAKNNDGSPKGKPEKKDDETINEFRERLKKWQEERKLAQDFLRAQSAIDLRNQ